MLPRKLFLLLLLVAVQFHLHVVHSFTFRPHINGNIRKRNRGNTNMVVEKEDRRNFLQKLVLGGLISAFSFSTFQPSATLAQLSNDANSVVQEKGKDFVPKTIVITGANSGIGLDAATKLSAKGHEVYLACRTLGRAESAAKASGAAGYYECDLTSLQSVKSFLKSWGDRPIDVLCLNAGVALNTQDPKPRFTAEGFEETIGVNHLAHFFMAQSLVNNLEKSKLKHPRLVVTASSVHDPDTAGGNVGPPAGLGDLEGFVSFLQDNKPFEMVDGSSYSADKAYKDSKLLNVLFTEELSRRLQSQNSRLRTNCFSPGLIPSTGLFRSQNPFFTTLFNFFAVKVLGVGTTISVGGDCLVYMVEAPEFDESSGGEFWATPPGQPRALFSKRLVSKEAQDLSKARRVWDLSEKLIKKVTA